MYEHPNWSATEIKVRKVTKVPYLILDNIIQQNIRRTQKSLVGPKMPKSHKRANNGEESDDDKPRDRAYKDLRTKSKGKSSRHRRDEEEKKEDEKVKDPKKSTPKNIGDITPRDLEKSIARAQHTVDKLKRLSHSLEETEVQKHRDAINATVDKTQTDKKRHKNRRRATGNREKRTRLRVKRTRLRVKRTLLRKNQAGFTSKERTEVARTQILVHRAREEANQRGQKGPAYRRPQKRPQVKTK